MKNKNPAGVPKNTIRQLSLGDEQAFDAVFRKYYPLLCLFARKYTTNNDIAEDIVQDVFAMIWERRSLINPEASLSSFLYKTVQNRCIDHLRHRKITEGFAAEKIRITENFTQESGHIEKAELREKILDAVSQLPPECMRIFKMSRFFDMKYREIAENLGISVKTVENQMGKALRILRERLNSLK
ncbi:MAG: RNA polymerase sigma-70 factor [Bacteroidetes bacterium]|nr:RNA polymerase sigma-70 factor [Bacteroidota bacterium]